MTPRALAIRKLRDGFAIHLSNNPVPRKFPAAVSVEGAIFDLEMEGYNVSRIQNKEARRVQGRHTRR